MTNQFKHTPEEARKLWVEALRSEIYKPGRALLEMNNSRDCLGVAVDMFERHEWKLKRGTINWQAANEEDRFISVTFDGIGATLPPVVQEWLGLNRSNGQYTKLVPTQFILAGHRPDKSTAAIIESAPPGLFKQLALAPSE